jgi:hypothetical protein
MQPYYSLLRLEFRSVRNRYLQALWCISDKGAGFPMFLSTSAGKRSAWRRSWKTKAGAAYFPFSALSSSAPELQNPCSSLNAEIERSIDRGERISSPPASDSFPGESLASGIISVINNVFYFQAIPSSLGMEATIQTLLQCLVNCCAKKENYEQV